MEQLYRQTTTPPPPLYQHTTTGSKGCFFLVFFPIGYFCWPRLNASNTRGRPTAILMCTVHSAVLYVDVEVEHDGREAAGDADHERDLPDCRIAPAAI